jgi:hypothetical protein
LFTPFLWPSPGKTPGIDPDLITYESKDDADSGVFIIIPQWYQIFTGMKGRVSGEVEGGVEIS